MYKTLRYKLKYSPKVSETLGQLACNQNAAFNQGVEWTLAHPNMALRDMYQLLTGERRANRKFRDYPVAIQRPGISAGRAAVRASDRADAAVLRECVREVKFRENLKSPESTGKKPRPPSHGNSRGRNTAPGRLYRRRKDHPLVLTVHDRGGITRVKGRNDQLKLPGGLVITLNRKLTEGQEVQSVTIRERTRQRHQRLPLSKRTFLAFVQVWEKISVLQHPLGNVTGYDLGVTHNLTASTEEFFDNPHGEEIEQKHVTVDKLKKRRRRCKRGSVSYRKLGREIGRRHREIRNLHLDFELDTAKEIAQKGSAIAADGILPKNMTRSASGTAENPGKNVAPKKGLNRSLSRSRPGELRKRIARECEMAGKVHVEVQPKYSSTECYVCGHRDKKSRKSQSEFLCHSCRHAEGADVNAAKVMARRLETELEEILIPGGTDRTSGAGEGLVKWKRMNISACELGSVPWGRALVETQSHKNENGSE